MLQTAASMKSVLKDLRLIQCITIVLFYKFELIGFIPWGSTIPVCTIATFLIGSGNNGLETHASFIRHKEIDNVAYGESYSFLSP